MERLLCLNFIVITANILGVLKFRIFTVKFFFFRVKGSKLVIEIDDPDAPVNASTVARLASKYKHVPKVIKLFFVLNSAEHEIQTPYKYWFKSPKPVIIAPL